MRNWMIGLLALSGSALAVAPGAMAQGVVIGAGPVEIGVGADPYFYGYRPAYSYYSPPAYGYRAPAPVSGYKPLARVTPPGVPYGAAAPRLAPGVYGYRAAPSVSYFSPPLAGPAPAAPAIGPGPGQCGTFFYWSEAAGGCVDARLR
ncbi:MAG: hypothetical protein KJZ80_13110 [Hyphomicrobiaceae bacterium]|nr:hypothetical protein [Hyphomicrobiaceae bacterium]